MGLAASQGRMLLLTARKNDVEFKLMSISNQKLALSRQASKLSENYSNALNTQRLQWADSTSGNLNYNQLFGSSAIAANATQYAIVNGNGQVVLSDAIVTQFGLDSSSGSGSQFLSKYSTQEAFIAKAMGTPNTAAVKTLLDGTTSNASDNSYAFATSYTDNQVFQYMGAASNGLLTPTFDLANYNKGGLRYSSDPSNPQVMCFYQQLGTKNAGVTSYGLQAGSGNLAAAVGDITADASTAVLATLKTNGSYSDTTTAKLKKAASIASDATISFYLAQMTLDKIKKSGGTQEQTENEVKNTNAIVDNVNGDSELYIDMTQVINTFLNYFDAECAKVDGTDTTKPETYTNYIHTSASNDTSTLSECYTIRSGPALGVNGTSAKCSDASYSSTGVTTKTLDTINSNNITDTLEVTYYKNLYEALATTGWSQDSNVTNSNYLDKLLQNGNYFLYAYNNGWNNASSNCAGSPLELVEDTEAVTKAEADYDAGKDKLDYKESQLDTQMNNLDTERSSIEAEMDSVQKLVDKKMDKFKMFQA